MISCWRTFLSARGSIGKTLAETSANVESLESNSTQGEVKPTICSTGSTDQNCGRTQSHQMAWESRFWRELDLTETSRAGILGFRFEAGVWKSKYRQSRSHGSVRSPTGWGCRDCELQLRTCVEVYRQLQCIRPWNLRSLCVGVFKSLSRVQILMSQKSASTKINHQLIEVNISVSSLSYYAIWSALPFLTWQLLQQLTTTWQQPLGWSNFITKYLSCQFLSNI